MAGQKGMVWLWWKWFPNDFVSGTTCLTLEEIGACILTICHCQTNTSDRGSFSTRLSGLANEWRTTVARAFEICLAIGSNKVCDLQLDLCDGKGLVDFTNELGAELHGKPASPFWGVRITSRRVVKDKIEREKEATRKERARKDKPDLSDDDDDNTSGQTENVHGSTRKHARKKDVSPAPRSRSRSREKNVTPPTPLTGEGDRSRRKVSRAVRKMSHGTHLTDTMSRINTWLGRSEETPWTIEEQEALELWQAGADPKEMDLVETYYMAALATPEKKERERLGLYPCRDPMRMLGKWSRQVSLAREFSQRRDVSPVKDSTYLGGDEL